MSETTTIQVEKKTLKELQKAKDYPEQTYNTLLQKMVETFRKAKESDQYDKFLHEIQKKKMKELWDNKEDEAWEHA